MNINQKQIKNNEILLLATIEQIKLVSPHPTKHKSLLIKIGQVCN